MRYMLLYVHFYGRELLQYMFYKIAFHIKPRLLSFIKHIFQLCMQKLWNTTNIYIYLNCSVCNNPAVLSGTTWGPQTRCWTPLPQNVPYCNIYILIYKMPLRDFIFVHSNINIYKYNKYVMYLPTNHRTVEGQEVQAAGIQGKRIRFQAFVQNPNPNPNPK